MYLTKWTQIFKLKNSFVLVFLWIQLLLILLTVIFYKQTVSLVQASEELANEVIIEGVYDKVDEVQKLSDAVAIAISRNTPLINAISNRASLILLFLYISPISQIDLFSFKIP